MHIPTIQYNNKTTYIIYHYFIFERNAATVIMLPIRYISRIINYLFVCNIMPVACANFRDKPNE